MATETIRYLTYAEAVVHHIELMRALGEHLTDHFLKTNGLELMATTRALVEMVQDVESTRMDLAALTRWMREHVHVLR